MNRRPVERTNSLRDSERARPRAGRRWRSTSGASALRAEVPCAGRAPTAAALLTLARPRRCCAAPLRSELDVLAIAPRFRASRSPSVRCAARRLPFAPAPAGPQPCQQLRGLHRRAPRVSLRGGRYPRRAIYGAPSIAAARSARATRAHPLLTRRDCLSAASFVARARCEMHSGVGRRSLPPHHEPGAGTARHAARALARRQPAC